MTLRDKDEARELTRQFELLLDKAKEQRSPWRAMEAEARRQVRLVSRSAGLKDSPPPDLHALARFLGVPVRETTLAMKGRLVREGKTTVVELDKRLTEFEKRLALAHEISHLVLENFTSTRNHGSNGTIARASGLSYAEIERVCDLCAEELLIPLEWLRDHVDPRTPSLALVEDLARWSDCPVEVVATIIIKNRLWGCRMLWCTWKNGLPVVGKSYPAEQPAVLASIRLQPPRILHADLPTRALQRQVAIQFGDVWGRWDAEWLLLNTDKALVMLY